MQLSGEMFKKIISQLKGMSGNSEQRAEPRVGLRNRVTIQLLDEDQVDNGQSHAAGVRDLSQHGIGLLFDAWLPQGTLFAIRFPVQNASPIVAVYKVMRCEMLEAGMYAVGGLLMKMHDPGAASPKSRRPKGAAVSPGAQ